MVVIVATCAFCLMVSCSKDSITKPDMVTQQNTILSPQDQLNRISEFKEQMDRYKSGDSPKDATYLSVEDAIWDVEALFNYTYAYPELIINRETEYDTALYLPINYRDSVLFTDLTLFYDQVYNAARAIFQRDTLSNKQMLLLDAEPDDPSDSQVKVTFHTLIGSVSTPSNPDTLLPWAGPYSVGQWWYYGDNGGSWDSPTDDATLEFTRILKKHLIQNAPAGSFYTYTNIKKLSTKDSSPDTYTYGNGYCEFYKNDTSGLCYEDLVLEYEAMNFHFFGEKDLIQNQLRTGSVVPADHKVCGIEISSQSTVRQNGQLNMARHWTAVWYGERLTGITGYGPERGSIEP